MIILGTVASPVVAFSHLAFYITSFVCLVAFMALFLKFTNESRCNELCQGQDSCTRACASELVLNICRYTPPVLAAFLLILFVFGLFYFLFTIMVQDYRQTGDLLSILGTFLPSAILAFAGYSGKKIIDNFTTKRDEPIQRRSV